MCGSKTSEIYLTPSKGGGFLQKTKSFKCGLVVASVWFKEKCDEKFFNVVSWCPGFSEKDYPDNGKGFYE